MPFVQSSEIEKYHEGSFENRILVLQSAIESTVGKRVTMLATHPERALAIDEDGKFHELHFAMHDGHPVGLQDYPADVQVIGEDAMPRFLASELRGLVADGCSGRALDRTRVRDLCGLLKRDEHYWLGDVLEAITKATSDEAPWRKLYEDQKATVAGRTEEFAGTIPTTRYTRLPAEKLESFTDELHDSLVALAGVFARVIDETSAVVFDVGDEKRSAVRNSLIVEAQAAKSLLSKAEKLMTSTDVTRTAEAHDRLAERAKKMVAVVSWLRPREPKDEE